MANVQLGDKVKEIGLFNFGVVCEVIEQSADIGRTGDHLLYHFTECFKVGGIVDGSKEELYIFDIYLILTDFFLQFYRILIAGV